jgi:gas vesicle protein
MRTTSKIIVATLAGVTTGIVLGLLFAPDKGSETRRKISDKYTDLSDQVKNKISDLMHTVKEEYNVAKDKASDLAKKVSGQTPSMRGEPDSYTS